MRRDRDLLTLRASTTRSHARRLLIGQCVNWGVLYYAFAVLVLPLERELGVPTWIVTGAFSVALLMSAAVAPTVGRWGDRDRGPMVMQAGGFGAAALLVVWTLTAGVRSLYIVWAGIGLCMAATLYEPAFVIIGRAHDDPAQRLRALAAVTLFGGLASTVFLPGTAYVIAAAGWRAAVLLLAALLAVSTFITRSLVFGRLPAEPPTVPSAVSTSNQALGLLGLRWRLFDFGRVDAQIAAARGQEAEALAAYRLAVLRATEDVENAFSALVKREAQVGILTQGESSFARARANSDAAYRGGVVSLIEVLDADSNLLQVRDAKAQAQTEAARAAVASFRALGGGWDARHSGGAAPNAPRNEQVDAHRQRTR